MNPERAILKGHLSELKLEKMDLETRISANIKAAKAMLAGASFTPIAKIDIHGASIQLEEAAALKTKLNGVISDMAAIEEELA